MPLLAEMTTKTVIQCYDNLFSIFGMPDMIYTDRANHFMSSGMKQYLQSKGVVTSNIIDINHVAMDRWSS